MKKSDAEKIVRTSCHDWFQEAGRPDFPSFYDYARWAEQRWSGLFSFKSTIGARENAEIWFDQELKQTWRN